MFNYWLQCSIDLNKKELLNLCFGQCHGLWMFLDQTSFTNLCLLIQKLKNLHSLACWGHKCVMGQINAIAMTQCGCRNLGLHMLRQHILLGRLVQWWSFSGLLPQYPDASELKQISEMWQRLNQQHKTTCLDLRCDTEDKYRGNSIIHGMVAHMHKQYGPLLVSEDCTYQTYPPPSLQSLLKLVLASYMDTTSALAIIMYFVLDVSNMQGKGDLLTSFCHTFSIPSSFFQQIYEFWLLDHGFVSNSLGNLLSPKTSSGMLSCHSYAVLRTLLRQGQREAALKYLYYTNPAIENAQNARLYVDVLLQNNHVGGAQILLRWCQPGKEYLLHNFTCGCENPSLCGEILASNIPHLKLSERPYSTKPEKINQGNTVDTGDTVARNKFVGKGHIPHPFSALLYQCLFNGSLTPGDFLKLFRESVTDLNSSKQHTRLMVVWPTYIENNEDNRNTSQSPETFCHLAFPPSPVELQKEQMKLLQNDGMEVYVSPADVSPGSTSADSMESSCSFIASSSPSFLPPLQHPLCGNHMPSKDVTQYCSPFTLTAGCSSKATLIKSLCKESVDELVSSENEVIDDKVTEPHSESIRAGYEREQFRVLSSESVYIQDSFCDEASGSSSFLDLKPLKRALEPYPPVKKSLGSFCYDPQNVTDQPEILTSCARAETMQELLEQIHDQALILKAGNHKQPSVLESVRSSNLLMDFKPVWPGSRPHQPQSSLGTSLLPLNPIEKTRDKATSEGRNVGIKEVVCFRTTSDRVGDYKLGSWWKQALETRRASTGLLPAIEQVPAVTKEKRHPLFLGWPQSHGLIRGLKQEVIQATKDESSRKAEGKRCKQVKQF
ncbi:uncharacterized protein LOC132852279 [Tachysurus vachellii]|uniref:uncharacterized protein LOC132852279 n=1 Tax=Tachysurus vachellii TaxID=175792 RepID=UPI00296B16B1|nr:uncharacterized protein LOC132852279 [Tachysurus vachellii]